jgi:hypothetical protein
MDLHVPGVGAVFGIGDDLHIPGAGGVLGSSMVPAPLAVTPGASVADAETVVGLVAITMLPDLVDWDTYIDQLRGFDAYVEPTKSLDAFIRQTEAWDTER